MTRPYYNQQKKTTCRIVDFAVLNDHRVKLKESGKKNKYLDLARELKKLWNREVTVKPIVIGALGTVTKDFVKGLGNLEIRGRVETIQITTWLRSARILRREMEVLLCEHVNHLRHSLFHLLNCLITTASELRE